MSEDLNDFEIQYSPSKWSKRFSRGDKVIQNHIKLTTEETEINKKKYNCKLNISYGETDSEKFDIYYKNEEFGKPIFVYIHGGYWQDLNKNISGYCVHPLVEQGYRVIIVGYNLCPKIKLNQIVQQIEKAIVKIFDYGNQTITNHISFCGHSAGAHLIAAALLNQSTNNKLQIKQTNILKRIFLISGIYDLTDLWQTNSVNCNNILGLDSKNVVELSPLYADLSLSKNLFENLKIFVIAGQYDSPVFQEQSEKFHKVLLKFDLKSEMKIFSNYDHFDIVESLKSNDSDITKYVIDNLF